MMVVCGCYGGGDGFFRHAFTHFSLIDFHMYMHALTRNQTNEKEKKLTVSMQNFGIHLSTCLSRMISKCDVNNPTYLLNLCTFVSGWVILSLFW